MSDDEGARDYDREFKAESAKRVLTRYNRFVNVPKYEEDKRLVFFLTMCTMLDRAHRQSADTVGQPADAEAAQPWNLTALQRNQERLFAAWRFDSGATMQQNFDRFVDRLLHPSTDSTLRFL